MNVIILTNSALWGGLEVHVVALAEAVLSAGHRTSVVCFGDRAFNLYRDRLPDGIELVNIGSPEKRSVWAWRRALAGIKADGAILEKGTWETGGLALDFALRMKARRYFTVQQLEPPELPALTRTKHFGGLIPGMGLWWYRWRWSVYLRSVVPHLTICVSETMRRRLASRYKFPVRKLKTIPNGVDPDRFRPDVTARSRARAAWGIPEDAFVFGSVGRFSIQKALEVAIEAFATLLRESGGRAAYLVLVGDGDQRHLLLETVARLGLEGRVRFPGFARDPREAYQGLDVFVIPSRYEGLPFALVEAMASGCEIIGTAVGGVPEAVSTPELGTLVPPDDAAALARAMIVAANRTPSDRAERARLARGHVVQNFDLRSHCLQIVSLLEESQH